MNLTREKAKVQPRCPFCLRNIAEVGGAGGAIIRTPRGGGKRVLNLVCIECAKRAEQMIGMAQRVKGSKGGGR